jgi:cell division septum initiation protein DivIVA
MTVSLGGPTGMNAAPHDLVETRTPGSDMFEVVWRGYDRDQVDTHIRDLLDQLRAERQAVDTAERGLHSVQKELVNAQQLAVTSEGSNSFGLRLEKMMRMAENEVAESRRKAAEDASAMMEKARAEAEAHRHDVEQQLINRATSLDQEAARRNTALQEREAEIAAELAAAKQRAEELRSDAEADAERVRQQAETLASQLRARAEKAAQQQRDVASREVSHLAKVQEDARAEIRRLHEMLGAELGNSTKPSDAAAAGDR